MTSSATSAEMPQRKLAPYLRRRGPWRWPQPLVSLSEIRTWASGRVSEREQEGVTALGEDPEAQVHAISVAHGYSASPGNANRDRPGVFVLRSPN